MKIAVITPVSHLGGVEDLLRKKGEIFLLEEGNKSEVRKLLLENAIDTILCNPNQQTYKIDQELLTGTNVSLINTCSTGMNHIDVPYCESMGIKIFSLTKDYDLIKQLPSTSELAFGLMSSLLRKIPESNTHVKNGGWDYTQFMGRQIKGLNIGIVGYGRLGRMMAGYCRAFGANVMICDPYIPRIKQTGLSDMFASCDVISLHVHVNDETKYMIDENLLKLVKEGSYLINTSRGEIVNEKDVVNAIEFGNLAGYGTDVIEDEFGDTELSPIIQAMRRGINIITTPHTGGMTIEGQTKAYFWAINKL